MLQPGDRVGDYSVMAAIGKGGMSRVYLVSDSRDGSRWALKVLTLDEPGIAERFVDEAAMQRTLKHRHIVGARERVDAGGRLGIVMDYVDGAQPRSLVARQPRCPRVGSARPGPADPARRRGGPSGRPGAS